MDSPLTPRSGPKPTWPIYKEVGADFIGELLDRRYKIVRRLAKGGMAHVFLAKDLTRKCYVAIKLLRACSPDARRRFAVEAEILSNIQHENIVRAIAFGHTADEQPYIALEHLDGETSSQRLANGPLPWREVAAIGIQIADALHALHRVGVIHRDIKPDNIILTRDADRSVAKLIDLGLASVGVPFHEAQDARFTPPVIRHKTQLGRAIGTPEYLPPEAGLCDANPLLDVYLLGATLYQLCTQLLPKLAGLRPIHEVNPSSEAPEAVWWGVAAEPGGSIDVRCCSGSAFPSSRPPGRGGGSVSGGIHLATSASQAFLSRLVEQPEHTIMYVRSSHGPCSWPRL